MLRSATRHQALLALAGLALGGLVACSGGEPKQASSSVLPLALPRTPAERTALRAVDAFHPERDSALASGGTVVVHTESLPKQLNPLLVNTAYAKRLLQDVHATLMVRGRSGGFEPLLAERVQAVSPTEWEVTLREGVRWHDGQPFSSEDVLFSLSLFRNPEVRCDDLRWQYERLNATATDARTLRFAYAEPYFQAQAALADLPLLPRHLYDLERVQPGQTHDQTARARFVNEHPANRAWIGLGPYRLARFDSAGAELVRFAGWFEPARAGRADTIRWNLQPDPSAAFRAVLSGELDIVAMVTTEDFYSQAAVTAETEGRIVRSLLESPGYWYVAWNQLRPALADVRVRQALAHAVDMDAFVQAHYRGLAARVSGPYPPGSPFCPEDVSAPAFDPERAARLLRDSGWKDLDQDGVLERDGAPLRLELLVQAQNRTAADFGAYYQEALRRVGIALQVTPLELAQLVARRNQREYDAVMLAWAVSAEPDPEQSWHSKHAPAGSAGNNFSALVDAEVDRLIEAGQRELDPARRAELWLALHRRIAEVQPYLFGASPLRKVVSRRALHGLRWQQADPNYVTRELGFARSADAAQGAPR